MILLLAYRKQRRKYLKEGKILEMKGMARKIVSLNFEQLELATESINNDLYGLISEQDLIDLKYDFQTLFLIAKIVDPKKL